MKLFSFSAKNDDSKRLGAVIDDQLIDISKASTEIPDTIDKALTEWPIARPMLESAITSLSKNNIDKKFVLHEEDILFHPPTTDHCNFRDFYAFLQHVKTARSQRGLKVVDEWYQLPVFYFSNPNVFNGHNRKIIKPKFTKELDFELEVACIIGKAGKNIPKEKAHEYIAGYTILNDFSARDIQRKEMRVGLGPAKGKDFASGLGPYLVTPDELENVRQNKSYNLFMLAVKNGKQISSGNLADIYFGFDEMIVYASRDVMLFPGDVIGSGTVGTGCIFELRPENTGGWLENGDKIELSVERLGKLTHFIKE
ncbi:MAG: fumarylacetoacetate hydrolase family protein [Calditrichaeota bacterium]|nr:fumarylacetoacetate hydrolase family protein [Calditrichota bacterium]